MRSREIVELTNMCMIYNDESFLVQEKIYSDGKGIIFPGGHVEPTEPITPSVIREMKEETGLTIEAPQLCGIKDWICEDGSRYIVFLYKTNKFTGELKDSEEGKVFWIKKSELKNYNIIWNMEEIFNIIDSDEYSELFFSKAVDGKNSPILIR